MVEALKDQGHFFTFHPSFPPSSTCFGFCLRLFIHSIHCDRRVQLSVSLSVSTDSLACASLATGHLVPAELVDALFVDCPFERKKAGGKRNWIRGRGITNFTYSINVQYITPSP
ncbi:unnamed protein product [Somion occarium]|uniref:Uncharacterized protein n=1 Tax=Somion occarium TaxID=3059160 RepID=A0ABP1CPT6_9APHY